MNPVLKSFYQKNVVKLVESFKSRQIPVRVFESSQEAAQAVLGEIQPGTSVGYGGSVTLDQLDLLSSLRKLPVTLFDRYEPGISKEEKLSREKNALTAHLFLSGVNAVSLHGGLYFVDGFGNRVAPILFGPERVILISGVNKLCPDRESALKRLRFQACPANAIRLDRKTPCAQTGFCSDCRSQERICSYQVEIDYSMVPDRITLFLILEDLGL